MEQPSRGHVRPADLIRVIEQEIRHGTFGRVHNLHVETTHERVVVRGRVGTHYVKQLALLAALSVEHGLQVCVADLKVV